MLSYSIIIPHKNIPDLLFRCYNSIPLRNDIEVIIVDDNSNADTCKYITDYFYNKHVKLILDKSNGGAGHARNIGLNASEGEWVLFADADDYFTENAFSIFDSYKSSDYDIIYFNTKTVNSDTLKEVKNRHAYLDTWLKNEDIGNLRYRSAVPWAKMIKLSLIKRNNITFHEIPVANDVWFSLQIGFYSKKIKSDIRVGYCATIRSNSLYYTITKERRAIRFIENIKVNEFLYKNGLKQYREEPLGYYWPILYKPLDILPFKYLIMYVKVEGLCNTILNFFYYIKYKLYLKRKRYEKNNLF